MSGHNKWSQIKEKKGKTDARKGQVFSKYAKLITNEARASKGDHNASGLRTAIERARRDNMPNDNIERAIKKATEAGGTAMENIMYEAYGPGGVALLIEVLTDSRNRAAGEVKHLLSLNNGNLAVQGAAVWAFSKEPTTDNQSTTTSQQQTTGSGWRATTTVPLEDADLEKLEKLVEALEANDDVQEVITNAE
ncbi:MAG: YebC/PmpR family DNA-binding transcriptional regulator [Candidatus Taylorbacteria bacterium CG11_big_fil_rev_8_21_14_0_20_46_11]|uniref:YebC/PmpR family DNA-binding transcriptional regulator n=1 Tax=Candidatus Taylorbacteria bacterium CG11_big_fil_rev_8_21_14_0_20_46_11 TaxID=1975025 RepID=A0A2H0KBU7_9BACT|nr:MAG: YebC/PmpR family DNA-binding transcriptional regulator [Candidatus Taylorbacteria bacterium CG11_big_fil_rev_8_21_14_0_20_46_11]